MKTVTEHLDAAVLWGGDSIYSPQVRRRVALAAIAAAVTEERARWLAWAADLGYDEQELPKDL